MRRLVIATTLLICLALAGQARAATAPPSFYGVMAAQDPDSTEIARMGTGKVGTLRINFVWSAVQPTAASPLDFSYYDAIIGAAAQQGIRVLPTVYSSPLWAAARDNYPPSKAHLGDFRNFVNQAAARYGSNGTFWSANPSIPKLPVTDWQLWNEMNSPSFWYRKPNAKQYVGLLRVFSPAIKSGRSIRQGHPRRPVQDAARPPRHQPRSLPAGDLPGEGEAAVRRGGDAPVLDDSQGRPARRPGHAEDHGPVQGQEGEALDHRSGLGDGRRRHPADRLAPDGRRAISARRSGSSPRTASG